MIGKEIRSSELKTTTGIQQTRKDSEPILPSITGGFFDEVRNSSPSSPETTTASTPKEPIITTSNLYKHAPTIVFIKEKYKNYLEWLASNYAANNAPDQTQPKSSSSSSPTTSHHLAWYDFEQSLSRKQKGGDNSHVRSVGSTATAAEKDEMLRYSLEHLDSSMASQNHKLLAAVLNSLRNSKEFNATAEKQRRLGLKLDRDAVRRPQMGEAQKKSTKKQMPPPPRKLDPLGSRESPSNNNTTSNQRQGVNNTQTKSQQQSNQRQAQIPVNPSPSRVQFMTEHHDPKYPLTNLTTTTTTSSSTTGNYYQYQTSVNSTPPILKPILKHAQSSMTVNPGVSSCSKRSSNAGGDYLQLVYLKRAQRKSSSTGSSSSNDDQASQSGASTSSSSSSYGDAAAFASLPNSKPLLPPILPLAARCSDDFYAVLNDMEKSKYV